MVKSYPEFAQNLHDHLENRDRSRAWLERQVKVTGGSISRMISYEARPGDPQLIYDIADVLKLSESECQALVEAAGYTYSKREKSPEEEGQSLYAQEESEPLPSNIPEAGPHLQEIKDGMSLVVDQNEEIGQKLSTLSEHAKTHAKSLDTIALRVQQQKDQRPQQDLQLPICRPFVGREDIVSQIIEQLQPGNAITLWGAGGQGKTSVAYKVISELRANGDLDKRFPDGTILHNFSAQPYLEAALIHIAKSLGTEEIENAMSACLRSLSGKRVLLIFESTEDADQETLKTLYALGNECGLLITTRRQTDAPSRDFFYPIGNLSINDAVMLLGAIVKSDDKSSPDSIKLCELLDSYPLAVRVAANYLVESGETVNEYVKWLEADTVGAISSDVVMEKTLQRIFLQMENDSRIYLALVACLAERPFSEDIMTSVLPWPTTKYKRARKQLIDYGLLRQTEPNQLQVTHAIIYQYARKKEEYLKEYLKNIIDYFIQMVEKPKESGQQDYKIVDIRYEHVIAVLQRCEQLEEWDAAFQMALYSGVGEESYLRKWAFPKDQIIALEIGLLAARTLGRQSDIEELLDQLGHLCSYHGQVNDGIQYLEEALTYARRSQERAKELNRLDALLEIYRLTNKEAALEKCEQLLSIVQASDDQELSFKYLFIQGKLYQQLDKIDEATKGNTTE